MTNSEIRIKNQLRISNGKKIPNAPPRVILAQAGNHVFSVAVAVFAVAVFAVAVFSDS